MKVALAFVVALAAGGAVVFIASLVEPDMQSDTALVPNDGGDADAEFAPFMEVR